MLSWKLLNLFSCTAKNNELVPKRIKGKTSQVYDFPKVWIFFEYEEFFFYLGDDSQNFPLAVWYITECIESREIQFLQNVIICKQFQTYYLAAGHISWTFFCLSFIFLSRVHYPSHCFTYSIILLRFPNAFCVWPID